MTDETREGSAGWATSFPVFKSAPPGDVLSSLRRFLPGAGSAQDDAWKASLPFLQREVGKILDLDATAADHSALLEYFLLLDERRADVLFLVAGPVIVFELKGKAFASQADLDQAAGYARDIAAYHRDCEDRPVRAVLVPTAMKGEIRQSPEGVWIAPPDRLADLVRRLSGPASPRPPRLASFLDPDAYRPLPTLIAAARELFERRDILPVWRAHARTDPAVRYVVDLARKAAQTKTRHLILVTGVPGSGKTLVGLRVAHSALLDPLAVPRAGGRSTSPALFLSGNGPLVEVLQYALRAAGGGGQTFVRHVKSYLDTYVPRPQRIPAEHVVVFDEAQRAFSADMVGEKHPGWAPALVASEPALFVRLAERVPDWAVVVGLVGTGQEIHLGEEAGIGQWQDALRASPQADRWTVHAPPRLLAHFAGGPHATNGELALNLDFALRFHLAEQAHLFVERLLDGAADARQAALVAERLWRPSGDATQGLRLWATRDLEAARRYVRQRYEGQPRARYGLLASSRDKVLVEHGVDNTWGATKTLRLGPWFMDDPESDFSCCRLARCVTEFQVQGLELDMALLAWGTDLRRERGRWVDSGARKYKRGAVAVRDPLRLRVNAYRVLLTRGRDGVVVFVPQTSALDETWDHLLHCGFRPLPSEPVAAP